MERKKAIEILKDLADCNYIGSLAGEDREALDMAIRCLKVDEMYGLAYEDADWYDKAIKENERLKKELEMLKLDRECEKPSGEWKRLFQTDTKYNYECSHCKSHWHVRFNYCPTCGTYMENHS